MQVVYKYQMPYAHQESIIHCPAGAVLTAVAIQDNVPCIWMLVDTNAPSVPRVFRAFGTGHMIDAPHGAEAVFKGTFFDTFSGGFFTEVYHLFEMMDAAPFEPAPGHDSADDIADEQTAIAADLRRSINAPAYGKVS